MKSQGGVMEFDSENYDRIIGSLQVLKISEITGSSFGRTFTKNIDRSWPIIKINLYSSIISVSRNSVFFKIYLLSIFNFFYIQIYVENVYKIFLFYNFWIISIFLLFWFYFCTIFLFIIIINKNFVFRSISIFISTYPIQN